MIEPLRIAIVGHTNAGKSSIVAALTRRDELRISDEHGTTRDVDEWTFEIGGEAVLTFLDTPGFDRAGAINEWLDEAAGPSATAADDPDLVARFIAEADPALFRSEQRALSAALRADVLAYVADATVKPKGQARQEVRLLGKAGPPVIGVVNVIEGPHRDAWFELFGRQKIHNKVLLDAMNFQPEQEARFYRALVSVLPDREAHFDRIAELRAAEEAGRAIQVRRCIAQTLVDVLSFQIEELTGSRHEATKRREGVEARFRSAIVGREAEGFRQLLELYGFKKAGVEGAVEVDFEGDWQASLFDAEVAKRYGASVTTLTLVGAAAGAPFELFGAHGLAAGAGALLGFVSGHYVGRFAIGSVDRSGRLTVGPLESIQMPIILVNRAIEAWKEIDTRSHASAAGAVVTGDQQHLGTADILRLKKLAKKASKNPTWSSMSEAFDAVGRADTVDEFAAFVGDVLEGARTPPDEGPPG
ncbi:MAG: DUF3482 domain-containing protein [Proteobacteria bacterium]|nr:DUF3482 domain-containing protein [Pseudomonadota bacterium]